MPHSTQANWLKLVVLCAALAGCASPSPVAYSGLASSAQLAPNPKDSTGRMPLRYWTPVNWRSYQSVILDPVVIYREPDNQFGDLPERDKATLAGYMQAKFTERLGTRFTLASSPASNTLRIRLTLTGAARNKPALSTVTRFDLAGGLYNGVQAVRGREGMFTGSVIYTVEIYDAGDDRLLGAFVTKQYPNAYNLKAGIGSLSAAEAGIRKGADVLMAQLG